MGLAFRRHMIPMTWQFSLAYQFDWNPWVTEIGAQGDFISIGYSGSKDMAGVTLFQAGVPTRIGFVPQSRLFLTRRRVGDGRTESRRRIFSQLGLFNERRRYDGKLAHGAFGLLQLNF